ncbi:MAG: zinc-binding alcohol dehydrogenase family protein [Tepidisphaeraceae bacterium]
MKTIVLQEPGQLRLTETQPPHAPPPGSAVVRVHRVGICGTDWHAYHGRQPFFSYPRIIGHELGVEIEAVNDPEKASKLAVGDRCCVEPYLNCGKCIACRRGHQNCCMNLQVMGVHVDGGMRERFVVPLAKLHRSAKLSMEQLALVETLGIGCHAVDRGRPEAGETALVIGAGPIGLSVIPFLQAAGVKVLVTDVSASRLEFCQAAMRVFVGLFQGDVTFVDPQFHRREVTLLASRNSLPRDFERIIKLVEDGAIDTGPWITHRAGCEELIKEIPRWLSPDARVIKAIVEF